MILTNKETGKKSHFTFEAVGACDIPSLSVALKSIVQNGLKGVVTRIVSIVGANEWMEKGWLMDALYLCQEAGVRLIMPPISPLHLVENGELKPRWNLDPTLSEALALSTFMDVETLKKAKVVSEGLHEQLWGKYQLLNDNIGILVTDIGLLHALTHATFFTKVSVLCAIANVGRVLSAIRDGAKSINLVPMPPGDVQRIRTELLRFPEVCLDIYLSGPMSIRGPEWYTLEYTIQNAPLFIEAGRNVVLKAEGVEKISDLLDTDYLQYTGVPTQMEIFLRTIEKLSQASYQVSPE